MQLEDIEEQTLIYLEQTSNPLVSFEQLHAHLASDAPADALSPSRLMDFLRGHDRVKVMESPFPDPSGALAAEGLLGGVHLILAERVPTADQLTALFVTQLDQMGEALTFALTEAREANDEEREKSILQVLNRVSNMKKQFVPDE